MTEWQVLTLLVMHRHLVPAWTTRRAHIGTLRRSLELDAPPARFLVPAAVGRALARRDLVLSVVEPTPGHGSRYRQTITERGHAEAALLVYELRVLDGTHDPAGMDPDTAEIDSSSWTIRRRPDGRVGGHITVTTPEATHEGTITPDAGVVWQSKMAHRPL